MKVLFYVNYPLGWARGGSTVQIMESKKGLEKLGVEVSWLHHEDLAVPQSDIIPYWGRPPNDQHWQLAKKWGCKVVASDQNPQSVLRPRWTWRARGASSPILKKIMGAGLYGTLGVGFYTGCDAVFVLSPYEQDYVHRVFKTPQSKLHVIPNGVDPIFLDQSIRGLAFDGLVYIAYIRDIKNSIPVARAAKKQGVRVKFIGGIHSGEDSYAEVFKQEVDNKWVFWEGEVTDRGKLAALIRGSKGSFIAGQFEAQSISILESLASGVPVMMSGFPNLKSFYGNRITYCHPADNARFPHELKAFYDNCGLGLKQIFPVLTWNQVSERIAEIYQSILNKKL